MTIGSVENNSALLLQATDLVRFVPNAQNATNASFTFRAWDRSSGTHGTKVDTTSNGGTTAFSLASEVASISASAVNDAPTIANGTLITLNSTNEDAPSSSTTVSSLLTSAAWSDVDLGAVNGIAITDFTANSTWQFSTDSGTTWTSIGAVTGTNALLLESTALVRYFPDGQNGETATFTFVAWDKTSGTASTNASPAYADATINGGSTAYSTQSAVAEIAVSSVNDAAIAVADVAFADEAGGVANGTVGNNPTGNVLANDTDVDDGDSMSVTGVASGVVSSASGDVASFVNGTYGSIQVDANGNYIYVVDNNNAVVQSLRLSGQTVTDTFTYTIQDSGGALSSTQIFVTVRGANDAPVPAIDNVDALEAGGVANATAGTNPTGNVLTNDIDVDGGDTKTVLGVVTGVQASASGNVGSSVVGSYGAVTIASDGSYSYVVDNTNATVQALRTSGDTLNDVFTYTMTDTLGLTSTAQVSVTIHGANDAPTASDDSAVAIEAGGVANGTVGSNGSGNVLLNDVDIDAGDTKAVSGVVSGAAASASGSVGASVLGQYGSVTIASDGSYAYVVDNSHAAVQSLRTSAQTLSEVFTYTMQDTGGLTSTATLTITIEGQNDAPLAVSNTASALEAGSIANGISGTDPTGNVLSNDTDVDSGDTKTVSGVAAGVVGSASGNVGSAVAGNYGSIVINANGIYNYTVDNNNATVEALNDGQSLTDTFTYTMIDAAGASSTTTIVITIDGADDLPFAVVDHATSEEAGGENNATPGTSPTGNVFTNDLTPNGNTLIGVSAGVQTTASGNVSSAVIGLYGSIVIDASGVYTYTLNDTLTAVEALRVSGDHLTDVFTYTFEDSLGYIATTQVTVTIDGANDNPIGMDDLALAVESGGVSNSTLGTSATGNVLDNDTDVDDGDTKHVVGVVFGGAVSATGSVGAGVDGDFGSVVVNADGTYTYTVNNALAAVQALRTSSDTLTDIFTYTMEDTAGAMATATLTVTIQGQNDNPVAVLDMITAFEAGGTHNGSTGSNPSGNVLLNDTDVDSGDTKTVSGVAAGVQSTASGNVASVVAGDYGAIQISSDGSYSYVVDNASATVQALRTSGQSLQDVFTYTVTDTAGATSSTQITVTIQGANDAPVATSDAATAIEAGGEANGSAGSNPTGNVLSNDYDVDAGDTANISGVAAGVHSTAVGSVGSAVAGAYGSIQINSNGTYSYIVDNSNATVQALRLSTDTITDIFTYTVQDASGATSSTQITITIEGRNDAPVGISDNNDAYESGGYANATAGSNATGNLIANDLEFDGGDTMTVSGAAAGAQAATSGNVGLALAGNYGSIVIEASGSYTYSIDEANAAVQALRLSTQMLSDVFSYTIVDAAGLESTTQVTVTIHGANDAPVANGDTGAATEAGGLANGTAGTNATGNVLSNDTDVDSGDSMTVAGVMAGSSGSPITNTGTSVTGSHGGITINANGSYTYVVDNNNAAVQALRASNQTLQDFFTYRMIDNAGLESFSQVTITIEGANDAPMAVADNTGIALEAGGLANGLAGSNATGNVLSNDTDVDSADNGETKTVSGVAAGVIGSASGSVGASVTGDFGSISIAADGSYSYIIDEANATVQALRTTANTITDIFTYTMVDADGLTSSTQVMITIQGANDTPTAVADNSAVAVESGGVANATAGSNATGNVLTNDIDVDSVANGETKLVAGIAAGAQGPVAGNVAASVNGTYGAITLAANGSYTYVIDETNASVQALRTAADTLTDVFTYTMVDAGGLTSTTQVTITIQGANDAPIAVADDTAVALEAGGFANGTAGSNATGNVLTNDTDVDSIAYVETQSVSGVAAGVQVSTSGNVGTSVVGSFGAITIASDGSYSYAVNNSSASVQALRTTADTLSDVFTYTLTDAGGLTSTTQVTITIQGANDAPLGVNDNFTAIEAGGVNNTTAGSNGAGNVLTNDTDVDSGDSKSVDGVVAGGQSSASGNVGSSVQGTYGSITINADGSLTYIVDNSIAAVQALRTNADTLTDLFTYSVVDASGLSSLATVTMTITGRNDAPVAFDDIATAIEAGGVGNATAGANGTGNALANDTDVDATAYGETKGVVGVAAGAQASTSGNVGASVTGNYGSITIAAHGAYTYLVNNSNAAVQALRTSSDTLTDTFTYTMADAAGLNSTATLTITITGQNDAPTNLTAPALALVENAINGTLIGTVTPTDVDNGDTFTYQLTNNANGRFAIDLNTGTITVADGTQLNRELADSHSLTVQVTDAGGLSYSRNFTIGVDDVNEFATGAVSDSQIAANSVAENAATGTTVGITAVAIDADATTNTLTYTLDDNAGGRFTIDSASGVVTVLDGNLLNYEIATQHSIIVRATSADMSFSTASFTINLADVNETPVGSVSDSDATANYVLENASIGSAVGVTASATDLDGTATVSYSLDDNAGGRFAIDANSGIVTVAGAIDREAADSYTVVIRATSSDTSWSTQSFTINVGDVNEFSVGAVGDSNAGANEVTENAPMGTAVGIAAAATDADATLNTITYSLVNNDGGRFAIDGGTGIVTVAGAIDRESDGSSRSITVRATSADGSYSDQDFSVSILDGDEFSVTAPTDSDTDADSVDENAAIGTSVGITASAMDVDSTNNTITYSLTSNPGGLFQIDAVTGEVTVAAAIDRETHGATRNITVQAQSSDGSTATTVLSIAINDVNEFSVSTPIDLNGDPNEVSENVAIGTAVGITANAFDLDATNNTITYSLTSNADGLFAVDVNTGAVTVAASINREQHGALRSITLQALSSDGSTATQSFNIAINDLNEFSVSTPTDSDANVNAVDENVAIGTTVGVTANAFDSDATTNAVTYSLSSNVDGLFQIDTTSGVITTAAAIDRETNGASRSVTVRATSIDGSTADQSFIIAINDVNEFNVTPVVDNDATPNSVAENAASGMLVGITAAASDADATTYAIIYTLDDDASGRFAIDSNSGDVTVADGSLLDYEVATSHSITVRAQSADGSSSTQSFTIQLTDINESGVTTVSDSNAAANYLLENSAVGTLVGLTAFASDADGTDTITYSLDDSASGLFAINANKGVVTVAGSLDRELAASYNITIRATSTDTSFTTQTFNLSLGDVDEADTTPVIDQNSNTNSVVENAASGTTVGITASASDADATTNTISYTLVDNDGGRFAIDATTGVVTVAGIFDREADGTVRSITIRATSADTSYSENTFTIDIVDANEFNVSNPIDSDIAVNHVSEDAAIGTSVGITASAFDVDATTNTVTYTLSDNPDGLFQIDPHTGIVITATAIDREVHGGARTITIAAHSSDGSVALQAFNIAVNDVNEFAVTVPADVDVAANAVNENVASGTAVGITGNAFDLDSSTNTITYSMTNNPDGLFQIDAVSGVVTTATPIDRELHGPLRTITIAAQSADGSVATQTFNIAINDVNEFVVVAATDTNNSANQVAENVAIGTSVGITAYAFDLDATTNKVTYSLANSAGGLFQIDMNTGIVTTAGAIDFELASSHTITIRSTSTDGSTSTANFAIAILNINEAPQARADSFTTTYADALNIPAAGLIANDTDPENDSLTATLVSVPNSGTLVLMANGAFTYTPVVPFVGDVSFQYFVSDGVLSSSVQTVTIHVTVPIVPPPTNDTSADNSSQSNQTEQSTSANTNDFIADSNIAAANDSDRADLTQLDIQAVDASSSSQSQTQDAGDGGSQPSGAFILDTTSRSSLFATDTETNSTLANSSLLSDSHRAVTRLSAQQTARLVQELSHTHDTLRELHDQLQMTNEVPPLEGVELIAKTAIGSGVVVWVIHVSQVMAALLAASSAWMHIDPLSVLNASKDIIESKTVDAAEAMFDNDGSKKLATHLSGRQRQNAPRIVNVARSC